MAQTIDEFARLSDTPPDQVFDVLRETGLLPETTSVQPVSARSLNGAVAAAAFAHVDPRRPHVEGRAAIYAGFAYNFQTTFEVPSLIVWGAGSHFSFLSIYGKGLGPNVQGVMSVDLQIFAPASTSVRITATNNPVTMTLTNAATGNNRVKVQVPFTSNLGGNAVVDLRPTTSSDGFTWYGTDISKL
jgi:hypothetical protein